MTIDALGFVRQYGVVLESAKRPAPNLAEAITGASIRGGWWKHPQSKDIFRATRLVREIVATFLFAASSPAKLLMSMPACGLRSFVWASILGKRPWPPFAKSTALQDSTELRPCRFPGGFRQTSAMPPRSYPKKKQQHNWADGLHRSYSGVLRAPWHEC